MQNAWNSVSEVVLEFKTNEVITLVVMALFLSAGTAGLFRLLNRGKVEVTTVLTSLVLASTLIAMLGSLAYLRSSRPVADGRVVGGPRNSSNRTNHAAMIQAVDGFAGRILLEFDVNRDGRLSDEEAAAAVTRVIHQVSAKGDHPGSIEFLQLRDELRTKIVPPASTGR